MKRKERAALAQETLAILQRGIYQAESGEHVRLRGEQADAEAGTRIWTPEALDRLVDDLGDPPQGATPARVEVTGETTLEATERLVVEEGEARVAALNFASARNPGGGFLGGSQAQEESLARSSGLYPCLTMCPEHYAMHRARPSGFYTHQMIYSPDVPVIRDDAGTLLAPMYPVSFITSPAVNAGVVRKKLRRKAHAIPDVMRERATRVLALAAHHNHEVVVLGAWGCGVFGNNPEDIAQVFHDVLWSERELGLRFRRLVFAVLDRTRGQSTRRAFDAVMR